MFENWQRCHAQGGGKNVYTDKGTALIRSQNVHNLDFVWDGLARITDSAANKLSNVTIEASDVLLNITGDSVARVCLAPESVLPARVNQHVAIIRPDSSLLNPHYLALYLASPYMQAYMLNRASGKGASRNAITKDMIASFEVPVPPLSEQESIVSRLNAFNTLIENNRKQIELLEEAAQRLYKEWFIDLHFPGYEKATFDPETGLTEGWQYDLLIKHVSVQYGYPFDASFFNSEGTGTPIVRIRNIQNGHSDDFTIEEFSDKYQIANGDLLVGMDGEFYINTWVGGNAALVQRSCRIKPDGILNEGYLKHALKPQLVALRNGIVGATVSHLGKKHIDSIKIVIPDNALIEAFEAIEKRSLLLRIANLRAAEARNRLLPKLISDEIKA